MSGGPLQRLTFHHKPIGDHTGGDHASYDGTSFAAPQVSGLLGIIRSMNPSVGRFEARHLVRSGAEDELGYPDEDLPGVDEFVAEQVSIPVGWWLSEAQREHVATTVARLCGTPR